MASDKMTHTQIYPDDIARMKGIAQADGRDLTDEQITALWERYSESFCAGWMHLPDEDELILSILVSYLKKD